MKTAPFHLSLFLLPIFATLFAACAQDAAPMPDDLLADDQEFMAVPNGSGADGGYLAIRKDVLDRHAFQLWNGKLLVHGAPAPRTGSPITDPPDLLAAYPIVDLPEFTRLRGANRYVLIDPRNVNDAGEGTTRVEAALGACDLGALCDDTVTIKPAPPPPDLVGSPFHRGPAPGHVVTVMNRGAGDAGASSTFVDFGPRCRNHVATPPIVAGSFVLIDLGLPERCFKPGVHVTGTVDEYNALPESNEANNTFTSRLL